MPDQQRIAERLLSILTDRDHAHTIVGDLAEMGAARGSKGFWRSVALTALGLAWRPAALILGCVALEILIGATIALSMSTHPTRSTNAWPLLPATIIGFSAMLLSGVALFNAARHGLRDPIAQLAAALTLVGWIGGSFHFFSPVLLIATLVFAALLLYAAISRTSRAACAAVILTLVGSWIFFFTFFTAVMLHLFGISGLRQPIWFPLNYALLIALQLYIPSRTRRFFA